MVMVVSTRDLSPEMKAGLQGYAGYGKEGYEDLLEELDVPVPPDGGQGAGAKGKQVGAQSSVPTETHEVKRKPGKRKEQQLPLKQQLAQMIEKRKKRS